MAEMGAAIRAMDLGALHPQQAVDLGADGIGRNRLKDWASRCRVEFGSSVKQRFVAANAAVGARGVLISQTPGEGASVASCRVTW
jgi:hypothetical protein